MQGCAFALPYLPGIHAPTPLHCRKLAYNRELAASINNGLAKMNEAKADISRMKVGGCDVAWFWCGLGAVCSGFVLGSGGVLPVE